LQPVFRITSLQVPQKTVEYIKILKYREKFQILVEISREICPEIGNTGIISVS
jgi:hypothetical protein